MILAEIGLDMAKLPIDIVTQQWCNQGMKGENEVAPVASKGIEMATIIANIKVWSDKGEFRVYVRTTDKREGCYYLTGNKWHAPRSTDGKLTAEEWKEARKLGIVNGKWVNRYESELHGTIFGKPVVSSKTVVSDAEDVRTDAFSEREYQQPILAESELYG